MASLGKKILSAFVEVTDSETPKKEADEKEPRSPAEKPVSRPHVPVATAAENKFSEHFHKLFAEANLPGPDYYEFSKMTEAMQGIADEKARFCAAFAGLQVQGLNRQKLLSSAQEYIRILEADEAAFRNSLDAALYEKVQSKKNALEETRATIEKLSQEIMSLQQQITALTAEIAEGEAKIEHSTAGYTAALVESRNKLVWDMEKIKQHIL